MTKILCSTDWHIILHKRRFHTTGKLIDSSRCFVSSLLLNNAVMYISSLVTSLIKSLSQMKSVLFLSYINSVTIPTYIIPGNHEATRKGESFFEHFTQENAIKNENVHVFTRNGRATVGKDVIPVLSLWRDADGQSPNLCGR